MAITLTPEQEQDLRQDAEALGYESAEAYLSELLQQLHQRESFLAEHRNEFSAMIDEGWDEAERGEILTAEEAQVERSRFKAAALAERSAAA